MVYTLGIDIGSSSVKVALLEVASGACAGSVTLPQAEADRCAAQGMGRTGSPDVVAVCLRGYPAVDERQTGRFRTGDRHYLPDARAGLSRYAGRTVAQVYYLVRQPGYRTG